MGLAYGKLEEYKKAIDCYDQKLKIDPKNINTLNNKGVSLNESK